MYLMERESEGKVLKSAITWIVGYGFIIMNLGVQLMYFLVHYISYLSCTINCEVEWDLYAHNLTRRLIFTSIFASPVFAIAWVFWIRPTLKVKY